MAIKISLVFFAVVSLLLGNIEHVFATATVTAATGGSAISADTAGGSYTALTGPIISEGATADIGKGTIILDVPSGFVFDTGGTAPTVLVTRTAGSGPNNKNINNVASGTSIAITSRTATQITFTVTDVTSGGVTNSLTWQNVRARPSAGTPLASGNITKSGTSSIVGVTGSTNFGALTEVAGDKTQLSFTTQPSSSATVDTDFATKPVIAVQDQFGNSVTSDNSTTITGAVVLSTQTCGGTAGTGALTSTPASGAAVTAGVMTYTAMQYSVAESIKICASSSGITSALSDTITVSAPADTTAPAAVTDLATGAVTSSSIALSWTAPGDDNNTGTATTYDVRYSTSAINSENFDSAIQATGEPAPSIAGSSETFTITGLSANTTYFFAIKTSDEVPNTSAISNVPSGTTSAAGDTTAPAAITDLALSGAAASSINLSWTAPGDDGNTDTATSYDIRYSTSVITEGNFSSATQVAGEPTPQTAGTSQSMAVSGLSSNTTYFFAMKTSDEVPNASGLSNVPSATTLTSGDTTAPAAITNLSLSDATVSSIKLTWTAPGDDGSAGTATSYDIRFSTALITDSNFSAATQAVGEPAPQAAGTSQSMTVGGLSSNTTYFFAMKASDEVPNISGLSNAASLATLAEVVSPVTIPAPSAGGVEPTEVTFSGRAYPAGRVKFFRRSAVDVREQNTFVLDTETVADSSGRFRKQFQALLQGTYFFAVEAQDKDGRSSGILAFTADLIGLGKLIAEDIFTPPTIGFDPPTVTRGKDLKVLGYASPNSLVEIEVDRILRYNTAAKADGSYAIFINTSRYSAKDHFLRAWQIDETGRQSPTSSLKAFKVTLLANPRADFNSDGTINITDWSIFLFRWRSKDADLRKTLDLDGDGKVAVSDFSIFLKAVKGL